MKSLIVLIAILSSSLGHAAAQVQRARVQCTLSLLTRMPIPDATELMIMPESGVYEFTYNPYTEKTFNIGAVDAIKNPGPHSLPQYKLVAANKNIPTILSIEFSKFALDGTAYEDTNFSVYLRLPTDKPGQSMWTMGGYSRAVAIGVQVTPVEKGYVVMNCRW